MATLTKDYQKIAESTLGNTGYGDVIVRMYAKYNSQSIENNTSNISVQCRIRTYGGYWYSDSGTTYSIGISSHTTGATSCNGQYDVGEKTLGTFTKDIVHNADGTLNVAIAVNFTSQPWGWNKTPSATVTLPTIPRASSVSSSSPYIGDSATIVISSASSSFTHTLTYSFGGASGTIATKTSATTVAWNTSSLKSSLYAQIPNAKSGSGTITCQTYSGNTLVGTKTCSFNLYAKESDCKPSISGSVVDTNSSTIALTGNSAVMVRYMSKPKVTISATANYSSSIKSYSINVDGQTTNSNSATYSTISSNSITISVTDSRGYSNSKTLTPSMIWYVKLTSNLTITRPEQTSNEAYLNGSGQWFNGTFSSSNTNTLSINCQYRKSGDSSWTDLGTLTPSKSGNTFSFSTLKLGDSFDWKEEYQFKITISDKLQTIGTESKDLIILLVGKPTVRIGKEIVYINGGLEINDEPISDGIIVSPTEPTTGEKVWIQKSNNLIEVDSSLSVTLSTDIACYLKAGTYTLAIDSATSTGGSYESYVSFKNVNGNVILHTYIHYGTKKVTFTLDQDAYSMAIWSQKYWDISSGVTTTFEKLRIVAGTEALPHDNYVSKKIFIKNDNDVYEEFYDENGQSITYNINILGGETFVMPKTKRFIEVYFLIYPNSTGCLTGKYTIDTFKANITFGSSVLLAHDAGGTEYYVSESSYNASSKTFTHKRTGYFNISSGSYAARNSNSSYHIYQIVTYD